MNPLRKAVKDYLMMRRSLGFKLRDMGYNLQHFVSFMEQQRGLRPIDWRENLRI